MQDWNTSWTATNNFETWCEISSQSIYIERLHEQWSWDTNNSQIHSEVGIGNHSKISKIPLQENPASTKQEYLEDEDDYCSSNNIKKKQDYCESTVLLAHFLGRKLCLPEKENTGLCRCDCKKYLVSWLIILLWQEMRVVSWWGETARLVLLLQRV